MPSYAASREYYERNPTAKAGGRNRAYVNNRWQDTEWDSLYDDPRIQEKARKGEYDGNVFGGEIAPVSKDPDYKWVATGTMRRPESSPVTSFDGDRGYKKPGSSVQPKWERIFIGGSKAAPAASNTASQAPAPQPQSGTPETVQTRREALERAQQFQAENAQIPRTSPPADPMAQDFYSSMNAYGKAYVDDYLAGRKTEEKRVALATEENAYFGNQALRQIDPKKMAISQPDTWKDTVARLKELRSMIT